MGDEEGALRDLHIVLLASADHLLDGQQLEPRNGRTLARGVRKLFAIRGRMNWRDTVRTWPTCRSDSGSRTVHAGCVTMLATSPNVETYRGSQMVAQSTMMRVGHTAVSADASFRYTIVGSSVIFFVSECLLDIYTPPQKESSCWRQRHIGRFTSRSRRRSPPE